MTNVRYTNHENIPLSVAVYLARDDYDYDDKTVSATALLKPLRQLILAKRVPATDAVVDIGGLVASRIGQSVHNGIEEAWTQNHKESLLSLGYPKRVADSIRINPEPEDVTDDIIPVYMEQRAYKDFMGVRISGKYDFVAEGRVEDFKTTSTFTYMKGTKDDDYIMQGSIYRWLNPGIITADTMQINFIFTDWKPAQARQEGYPSSRVVSKQYVLKSVPETEAFIRNKLIAIDRYKDADERDLPECTPKDLWQGETEYKYYKNPQKRARATKNFGTDRAAAYERLTADGNVGIVVDVPGQVKACKYCPGFSVCTQKDRYIDDGSLKL